MSASENQYSSATTSDVELSNVDAKPATAASTSEVVPTASIGSLARIARHFFANLPILLMAFNTFSATSELAYTISSQEFIFDGSVTAPGSVSMEKAALCTSDGDDITSNIVDDQRVADYQKGYYEVFVGGYTSCATPTSYGLTYESYRTCTVFPTISMTCYEGKAVTVSTALNVIWAILFFVFICLRLYYTWPYQSDDLRFFIALDKTNERKINRVMVYVLMFYTLVCFFVAVHYSIQIGTTSAVVPALVFVGINFATLLGYRKCVYLSGEKIKMRFFPKPITFNYPLERSMGNVWGGMCPLEDLFKDLYCAAVAAGRQTNGNALAVYGDASLLTDALAIIAPTEDNSAPVKTADK